MQASLGQLFCNVKVQPPSNKIKSETVLINDFLQLHLYLSTQT